MAAVNIAPTAVHEPNGQSDMSTVSNTLTNAPDGNAIGDPNNRPSVGINPTVVYPNHAVAKPQHNASVPSITPVPMDRNGTTQPRPDMSVASFTLAAPVGYAHPGMSGVSITPTVIADPADPNDTIARDPGMSVVSVTPTVARDPNETTKEKINPQPSADVEKQPVSTGHGAAAHGSGNFPEGSLKGWLTVLGAWLVRTSFEWLPSFCAEMRGDVLMLSPVFATFGYSNAFGVFQAYYVVKYPHQGASAISWVGSIQLFLQFSLGAIAGPLYDKGFFYYLVYSGSCIYIFW